MICKYHCKMDYFAFKLLTNTLWTHSYGDTVKSIDSLFEKFKNTNPDSTAYRVKRVENIYMFDIPISLRKHVLDDRYLDYTLYINYEYLEEEFDREIFEDFISRIVRVGNRKIVAADVRHNKANVAILTIDSEGKITKRKDSEHVVTDHCCLDYLLKIGDIEKIQYRNMECYEMMVNPTYDEPYSPYTIRVLFDLNLNVI